MSNITINVVVSATPELLSGLQAIAKAVAGVQPAAQPSEPPAPAPAQPPAPVQQQPAPVPTTPTPAQAPVQSPAPATVVPTTAPTYTMEQLAVAATQLVDAGRREELVRLLGSFGVQALTALPKEQYGNFATQLRAMGAKI